MAVAGWGMHAARVEYSRLAIEGGILLGNAGILAPLLIAYNRSQ